MSCLAEETVLEGPSREGCGAVEGLEPGDKGLESRGFVGCGRKEIKAGGSISRL